MSNHWPPRFFTISKKLTTSQRQPDQSHLSEISFFLFTPSHTGFVSTWSEPCLHFDISLSLSFSFSLSLTHSLTHTSSSHFLPYLVLFLTKLVTNFSYLSFFINKDFLLFLFLFPILTALVVSFSFVPSLTNSLSLSSFLETFSHSLVFLELDLFSFFGLARLQGVQVKKPAKHFGWTLDGQSMSYRLGSSF